MFNIDSCICAFSFYGCHSIVQSIWLTNCCVPFSQLGVRSLPSPFLPPPNSPNDKYHRKSQTHMFDCMLVLALNYVGNRIRNVYLCWTFFRLVPCATYVSSLLTQCICKRRHFISGEKERGGREERGDDDDSGG